MKGEGIGEADKRKIKRKKSKGVAKKRRKN